MSDLNRYISLFIPSLNRDGNKIRGSKRNEVLQLARIAMVEDYGGFTEYKAVGGWKGESGEVVTEQINVIKSFYKRDDGEVLESVTKLALWVKKELDQECVTIEQNEEVYFI